MPAPASNLKIDGPYFPGIAAPTPDAGGMASSGQPPSPNVPTVTTTVDSKWIPTDAFIQHDSPDVMQDLVSTPRRVGQSVTKQSKPERVTEPTPVIQQIGCPAGIRALRIIVLCILLPAAARLSRLCGVFVLQLLMAVLYRQPPRAFISEAADLFHPRRGLGGGPNNLGGKAGDLGGASSSLFGSTQAPGGPQGAPLQGPSEPGGPPGSGSNPPSEGPTS